MRRIKMKSIKKQQPPLIILTAGGTGGHVYPAESLAAELQKRGYRLALVTDSRGKDNYRGTLAEIPNHAVLAGGIVGKSLFTRIKNLFKTCLGILQAGYILFRHKPVCVVGFGGYASFPCSMAAILLGTDLVIHEQNSVMSRTNRFLSKYANLIALSFKNTKYTPPQIKTVLTGMPIRETIAELHKHPYPESSDGNYTMLILGGSQGAKVFGEIVPEAVKKLPAEIASRLTIYQQCRQCDVETLKQSYAGCPAKVTVSHFFNNMPELYAASHLIISRSGASSVSEIAAVGIPSILVPLPIAADDHQTGNAKELADIKGGIVMKQNDFTAETLQKTLSRLFSDPEELRKLAQNTRRAGIIDAASRLADAVEKNIISKK